METPTTPQHRHDKMLIDNYVGHLWGELNRLRSAGFIFVPLVYAFSVIEASAKLAAPEEMMGDGKSRERFCWWANKYLRFKDGNPYPSLDLYGSRCGLLHGFEAESDLYKRGRANLISWTWGDRQHHRKTGNRMIILSAEEFLDDLNQAGLRVIAELKVDPDMNVRFAGRLPNIFGAHLISSSGSSQKV